MKSLMNYLNVLNSLYIYIHYIKRIRLCGESISERGGKMKENKVLSKINTLYLEACQCLLSIICLISMNDRNESKRLELLELEDEEDNK